MGISTVSGPFRSKNGFQELVNGEWVPVAGGGGGGNPNDIVIRGSVSPNDPTNIYGTCGTNNSGCSFGRCFFIQTGFTMGEIQESVQSGGKWSCFSGYDYCSTQFFTPGSHGYDYLLTTNSITAVTVANCVNANTCTQTYELINYSSSCGSLYPYPVTCFTSCVVVGGVSLPTSTVGCGSLVYSGAYCFPNFSLNCPALILFDAVSAGNCGFPYYNINYQLTLKFDRSL